MEGRLSMVVFLVTVVAAMQLQSSMAQSTHVVGDALGWTIPPGGAVAYTTWASQQNFTVGDILLFNFTTGAHDVAEVTQAAYDPCTIANPISANTAGPASLTLTAGPHYYICRVGSHCSLGQKLAINVSAVTPTPPPASPPATPPPSPTPAPASPPRAPTPAPASPPAPIVPTPAPAPSTTATPPTATTPTPSTTATPPPSTVATPPTTSAPSPPGGSTTPPPPPQNSSAPSFTGAAVPAAILSIALAFFY